LTIVGSSGDIEGLFGAARLTGAGVLTIVGSGAALFVVVEFPGGVSVLTIVGPGAALFAVIEFGGVSVHGLTIEGAGADIEDLFDSIGVLVCCRWF